MKSSKRKQPCVYCGKSPSGSVDHIPPKSLFAKPRPSTLVTVPSCKDCNEGASTDDEYLRLMLTMRDIVDDHPDAVANLPSVLRSLTKDGKRRMREALFARIREVELHTPAGIYVGNGAVYDVDLDRFDNVVARSIKGLFYHQYGRRLPATYDAVAWAEDGLRSIPQKTRRTLEHFAAVLYAQEPQTIGDGVFTYWFKATDEDTNMTAWIVAFYEAVRFIGITVPKDDARGMKRSEAIITGTGDMA